MTVDWSKPMTAGQMLRLRTCELIEFVVAMALDAQVRAIADALKEEPSQPEADRVVERNLGMAKSELDVRIPARVR